MHAQEKLVVEANTLSNKETFNTQCSANAGAGANSDCKGLVAQETSIKVKELVNQKGLITGQKKVDAQLTTSLNNQEGLIQSSEGKVNISKPNNSDTLRVDNTQGNIEALEAINLNAQALTAEGRIKTPGNFTLNLEEDLILNNTLQNGASQEGAFQIGKDFTFTSSADFINNSQLRVGQNAQISVNNLTNSANAEISATKTFLNTQTLTNRGLVDGNQTVINSAISLTNIGTGRIYGDKLALETLNLENKEEGDSSATIAARNSLEIGANHLLNQNDSLIFSVGSINFAKTLDANFHAVGKSEYVHNYNAQIEALNEGVDSNTHALTFNTQSVENRNNLVKIRTETFFTKVHEFSVDNGKTRYPASTPGLFKVKLPSEGGLNAKTRDLHKLYIPGIGDRYSWIEYNYTRTTREDFAEKAKYKEGQILTVGNIDFGDAKVVNVDSKIIAGQDILLQNGNLENRATIGIIARTNRGSAIVATKIRASRNHGLDHFDTTLFNENKNYSKTLPNKEKDLELNKYLSNSNPNLVPHTIAEKSNLGTVNLDTIALLPSSSLYNINPSSSHGYLVETDPRFTDRRQWLSSDYMTEQLQFDPNHVHKRLGDGFYELQLVNEQINRLTGRYFLGSNSNNIEQYKALMNNGVKFSKDFKLTVGVELSAQQMEKLTTDIVWLVNQEVTLPNGAKTKVLVPKVYLASGSLTTNGYNKTIISANNIIGKVKELNNNGTLLAGEKLNLSTENLSNEGFILGNDIDLQASHDLINNGGTIEGGDSLTLYAGNNLTIDSAVTERLGNNFSSSAINKISTIRTTNENSKLVVKSNKNITVSASDIESVGTLSLEAKDKLSINTKKIYHKEAIVFQYKRPIYDKDTAKEECSGIPSIYCMMNHSLGLDAPKVKPEPKYETIETGRVAFDLEKEVGSSIRSKGDLTLSANKGLEVREGSITSKEGTISLLSEQGDITLKEGRDKEFVKNKIEYSKDSFFNSSTTTNEYQHNYDLAKQTTIASDNNINLQARKGAVTIQGSNVVANNNLTIEAKDVDIVEARNSTYKYSFNNTTSRGLGSSGGLGFFVGKKEQEEANHSVADYATSSIVGTKEGNITIISKDKYSQRSSEVISTSGDIDISAQKVDITAGNNSYHSDSQHKMKQSGFTFAVHSGALDAIDRSKTLFTDLIPKVAPETKAKVEKFLGTKKVSVSDGGLLEPLDKVNRLIKDINLGKELFNNLTDLNQLSQTLTDVSASLAYGRQVNMRDSESILTVATGSNITTSGKVTIKASGGGKDSNINVKGSDIAGKKGTTLEADNTIKLEAAKEINQKYSTNKSYSYNLGVAASHTANGNAVGVTAGGSRGKGYSKDERISWKNSHVGDLESNTQIISGGDTTLKGAQVKGKGISIDTTNLNIESLQDTMSYKLKQSNISGQVTVGQGFSAQGNFSKSKLTAEYSSVQEQSGILAGDEGYKVEVKKHTTLTGGLITSTAKAEQENKNSFTTGTLSYSDLTNYSKHRGDSFSLDGSLAMNFGTPGEKGEPKSHKQALNEKGEKLYLDHQGKQTTLSQDSNGNPNTPQLATGIDSLTGSKALGIGKDKGKEETSLTRSGINTANITILDEDKQKEINKKLAKETIDKDKEEILEETADSIKIKIKKEDNTEEDTIRTIKVKTVAETIADIKTSTTTDTAKQNSGKLKNNFDPKKVLQNLNTQIQVTKEFKDNAYTAIDNFISPQQKELVKQVREAKTEEEKTALYKEIYKLQYQRQFLETLVGMLSEAPKAAITDGVLQAAATRMRQESLHNSRKFKGVIDEKTGEVLSNVSYNSGYFDGVKLGGVRVDLDAICGQGNKRYRDNHDGSFTYFGGKSSSGKDIPTLQDSLNVDLNPDIDGMYGPTGGAQGLDGQIGPLKYGVGSALDGIVEGFAGSHDYLGGEIWGFYDELGNTTRGRGIHGHPNEHDKTRSKVATGIAIFGAAPFALSDIATSDVLEVVAKLFTTYGK